MSKKNNGLSPRLQRLQETLKTGKSKALQHFWEEIKQEGTPLIEELEDDEHQRLVTFLWQAEAELRSVALVSLMTKQTTYPLTCLPDIDLWYVTLRLPSDLRATYQFFPDFEVVSKSINPAERWNLYRTDPFNPKTFAFYTDEEDPTEVKLTRSVLEMPDAPPQPWVAQHADTPKGKVELHRLQSDILGNERRVWVYTPAGYNSGADTRYALLVLFDGWGYAYLMPTFTILDSLIATGEIPPTVMVMPDSLEPEVRMKELVYHPPFNQFLVTELIPWALTRYAVTSDAGQTVVGGSSAGGLAAAYAALEHPEVFGNVLSQSGAFTLLPEGETESGWLARQFATREKLPIKFHLDAGTLEVNSYRDLRGGVSPLAGNQHLREALIEKGYDVHYTEFSGGHDYISWQGTFGEGLAFLLG